MTKKTSKKVKAFLEQLHTIPNISLACEKVGLTRNTIYRWCKDDPEFQENVDLALSRGEDSITDLAESKLITHINSGNLRAIKYWLDNRKKEYMRPRPKDYWKKPFVPVDTIIIEAYKDPLDMPLNKVGDIQENEDDGYGDI